MKKLQPFWYHNVLTVPAMGTFEALVNKVADHRKNRMPAIAAIHALLDEMQIAHTFEETKNVVEHRTKGNRFVNKRYDGKRGNEIKIEMSDAAAAYVISGSIKFNNLHFDTSDSYYSRNSYIYAEQLVRLIEFTQQNKKPVP